MADKAKITQTSSGPVAHVEPGESLDLTETVEVDPASIGSTARSDPEPTLVDTSAEQDVKTEGDKTKAGHVAEVDRPPEVLATAGELRKAGYQVPDEYKDKDIPSRYNADTPTPPGEVHLVQQPAVEDTSKPKKATSKALESK